MGYDVGEGVVEGVVEVVSVEKEATVRLLKVLRLAVWSSSQGSVVVLEVTEVTVMSAAGEVVLDVLSSSHGEVIVAEIVAVTTGGEFVPDVSSVQGSLV